MLTKSEKKELVTVEVIEPYRDLEKSLLFEKGEKHEVTMDRAKVLVEKKLVKNEPTILNKSAIEGNAGGAPLSRLTFFGGTEETSYSAAGYGEMKLYSIAKRKFVTDISVTEGSVFLASAMCEDGGVKSFSIEADPVFVTVGVQTTGENILGTNYSNEVKFTGESGTTSQVTFRWSDYSKGYDGKTGGDNSVTVNITIVEDNSAQHLEYVNGSGDANLDGTTDLSDAQLVLKAALGIQILASGAYMSADVDGNNVIELSDAQMVLKASLSIVKLNVIN